MAQIPPEHSPFQPAGQGLPPDIAQLATHHQLNPFVKAFHTDTRSLRNAVIMMGVVIAIMVIFLILDMTSGFGGIFYEILVIILGISFFFRAWFGRGRVVYLFQNGIIYNKGARYEAVHWQQIKKLRWRKKFLTDPAWFQMSTTDGRKGAFTYLKNPEDLYYALEQGHRRSQP